MEQDSTHKIYQFNAFSNVYDLIFKQVFYPRQRYAIKCMDIKPGEKILDVGIGTGLSLPCYPKDCHVTGIDLSASMLKKAKKKVAKHQLENVTLLEMDACNLDFEDNEFDHVIATFVLTVVPDPIKALSEMKRVCKKGNPLVVVNHFMSDNKFIAKTEELINPICRKLGWRSNVEMNGLFEEANMEVESCRRMKKLDLWSIVFTSNSK